jgi:hypothetical protein
MPNEGRYIPLEIQHLLEDGARRRGTSYEHERYLYETSELEKLVATARAEDVAREATETAISAAERAAAVAKAELVAAHCEKMFAAALNFRSNCVKFRLFSVLQGACERVALYDSDDHSPANKLAKLVARSETWLFDEPDPERFHRAIVYAFQRSGFTDFSGLAEALRVEEEAEAIMALRRSTFTRRRVPLDDEAMALMKRRVPARRNPKTRTPQLPPFPSSKRK